MSKEYNIVPAGRKPSSTGQPLQREDLRPCDMCGKGLMHSGLPLFWRVHIERMGVDVQAVQRRAGMEQFFGGGAGGSLLAGVMGDGAPLASPFNQSSLLLCEPCAIERHLPVAAFTEWSHE